MSVDIIPPGASAVVTENHRHEGNRHPDNWDLSTEMQTNFSEVTNQAERNEAASVVRASLTSSQVASSELNTQKIVDESMLRADTHYEKSQKQVSDLATANVASFKDAAATAYQLSGQALLDSAKNAAALSVQATANFNALTVQATQNQYDILLDSQKNAAAGVLLATQLAAAAAAQAAECCCELKEKINATFEKDTRSNQFNH